MPTSTSACAAAGFMLDFGEDEPGSGRSMLRRGSGYYIDVGASELIADGAIKLKPASTSSDSPRTPSCSSDGTRTPGRPHRLCHGLRLDERLGGAS